jgi:hypothetical protein
MLIYALFHWHSSPLHLIYFLMFFISPQKYHAPFLNECPQKKNPFRRLDKQLVFILFITYSCYSYDVQPCLIYMILILPHHCLIYDPDSSPSLSYIWSWFFPVMQCPIYDPDSSPSLSYIWSWFFPCHCLIYDPDSSQSLSYIWSWFFPVTVLYMIHILPRHCHLWSWFFPVMHCLIYDPESSLSLSYIWSWFFPISLIYDPDSSPSLSYIW